MTVNQVISFLNENLEFIYLLSFVIILGFEVISKVPTILHTPLMSGSNAISGIIVIGAILLVSKTDSTDYVTLFFGALAIILGSINVVGGFSVTNRMLSMFNNKKK